MYSAPVAYAAATRYANDLYALPPAHHGAPPPAYGHAPPGPEAPLFGCRGNSFSQVASRRAQRRVEQQVDELKGFDTAPDDEVSYEGAPVTMTMPWMSLAAWWSQGDATPTTTSQKTAPKIALKSSAIPEPGEDRKQRKAACQARHMLKKAPVLSSTPKESDRRVSFTANSPDVVEIAPEQGNLRRAKAVAEDDMVIQMQASRFEEADRERAVFKQRWEDAERERAVSQARETALNELFLEVTADLVTADPERHAAICAAAGKIEQNFSSAMSLGVQPIQPSYEQLKEQNKSLKRKLHEATSTKATMCSCKRSRQQ